MSSRNFGNIRLVTPSDTQKIKSFNYLQVGGSGDVVVKFKEGATVTIKSSLLDRMAIVPIGEMDQVLSTGTTATDIYVW